MARPFVARSVAPVLPIRMIALDIDGTLVDDDLVVGERTRAAIGRAVHRGIRVSLVTGRMTTSAVRFAASLGLTDPVVGYQGALAREMPVRTDRVGRLLRHFPLRAEVAREAVAWSRSVGLDPHANHLEQLIIPADDPQVDDYSAFLGTRAVRVPDLGRWIRHSITKIVAVGPPGRPNALLGDARERFRGRADVTVAHPRFLEFVAPGVSKGGAVAWLARRHGIPLGQVLTIGDQLNDIEMLRAVGHGTAMPEAPDDVIMAARYVAPPLADEGAGDVISRLALSGARDARLAAAELEGTAARLRARLIVRPGA
ncbi:MAG TPA: Cof-type HAD-IIB family hydrolase [Candidatus Sulfomarinibacteraceae bacterium]|nr:Cof-type HAD-IIB family hydrolase [Candidatus Sulfomarinibacteraceae bacterium]